jgi:hypothetical protein
MTLVLWTLCAAGALYLIAWLSFRLLTRKPGPSSPERAPDEKFNCTRPHPVVEN